jgi:hypothetical protein
LVVYWTGSKKDKKKVQAETINWIPDEEVMDAIPLRVILPGEEESISYHPDESDSHK